MTVTIQLQDQTAEALTAQATARGMSLEAFLAELATIQTQQPQVQAVDDAVEEFDNALDELFAGDTRPLPPLPLPYSREDIYSDHD